jgi:hypothetical protein
MHPPLEGCMWASCWPLSALLWFLPPSMSLTRTRCVLRGNDVLRPPPGGVGTLLPMVGCLLLSRRYVSAPWAVSVCAFPRVARESPLGASTCCDFTSVAWEFLVFPCVVSLVAVCAQCIASLFSVLDSVTLIINLSLLPFRSPPPNLTISISSCR